MARTASAFPLFFGYGTARQQGSRNGHHSCGDDQPDQRFDGRKRKKVEHKRVQIPSSDLEDYDDHPKSDISDEYQEDSEESEEDELIGSDENSDDSQMVQLRRRIDTSRRQRASSSCQLSRRATNIASNELTKKTKTPSRYDDIGPTVDIASEGDVGNERSGTTSLYMPKQQTPLHAALPGKPPPAEVRQQSLQTLYATCEEAIEAASSACRADGGSPVLTTQEPTGVLQLKCSKCPRGVECSKFLVEIRVYQNYDGRGQEDGIVWRSVLIDARHSHCKLIPMQQLSSAYGCSRCLQRQGRADAWTQTSPHTLSDLGRLHSGPSSPGIIQGGPTSRPPLKSNVESSRSTSMAMHIRNESGSSLFPQLPRSPPLQYRLPPKKRKSRKVTSITFQSMPNQSSLLAVSSRDTDPSTRGRCLGPSTGKRKYTPSDDSSDSELSSYPSSSSDNGECQQSSDTRTLEIPSMSLQSQSPSAALPEHALRVERMAPPSELQGFTGTPSQPSVHATDSDRRITSELSSDMTDLPVLRPTFTDNGIQTSAKGAGSSVKDVPLLEKTSQPSEVRRDSGIPPCGGNSSLCDLAEVAVNARQPTSTLWATTSHCVAEGDSTDSIAPLLRPIGRDPRKRPLSLSPPISIKNDTTPIQFDRAPQALSGRSPAIPKGESGAFKTMMTVPQLCSSQPSGEKPTDSAISEAWESAINRARRGHVPPHGEVAKGVFGPTTSTAATPCAAAKHDLMTSKTHHHCPELYDPAAPNLSSSEDSLEQGEIRVYDAEKARARQERAEWTKEVLHYVMS